MESPFTEIKHNKSEIFRNITVCCKTDNEIQGLEYDRFHRIKTIEVED